MPKQRKTKQERFFSIPVTAELPETDADEAVCYVVCSACDFNEVNRLATSLQIQRRPDKVHEILDVREIRTKLANADLEMRT